jgi:hypothetical protein
MNAAGAHLLNVARIGPGVRRPTAHPVKAPQPDDDVEGGELPAEAGPPVHREIDPDRLHSAFTEARRPYSWVRDGARPRDSWFDR